MHVFYVRATLSITIHQWIIVVLFLKEFGNSAIYLYEVIA